MTQDVRGPSEPGLESRRTDKRRAVFGPGSWVRRFARLWGFLGFVIFVVVLARSVLLPFVFALLVAYVLAPVIDWMSLRNNGTRRMPRWTAIILCYSVLLTFVASFVVVLMPLLSKDAARIGRELPTMYQRLDQEWAPGLARWLEHRLPSIVPDRAMVEAPAPGDAPLPPGTAFVLTPLPDGRMAVQLGPGSLELEPRTGGGFELRPSQIADEHMGVEEKIRAWAASALTGLQSEIGDFFRFGQAVISALVRSVFGFFLVLMVAAFILIDIEKLHGFVRGLVPEPYRIDYDIIAGGINRGLSGVIRGQLLICLVNGVLTYIGLVIFSVKYSLFLAMVAAVMSLVPIFGSILSTLPIVLAALVSGEDGIDIWRAVAAVAWIVGIHFVEANFLNPKIIGSAARIHPVLVIFALIVGEHGYGLVGALLAVPVLSMIQVLFLFFRKKAWHGRARTEDGTSRPGTS